jgi:WD40 repeat protein/serine/threonine protein kinase/tetratricopeptide (TPR) repeat protein
MPESDQTERERRIFEGALDIVSREERLGYIKGACGNDVALLDRIQDLLSAHDRAEGFLPESPPELSTVATVSEKPGDKIGHYKLLQNIGEGGCGIVYMAEQEEPVRRRVALKIIKLGMDTKQVTARFEAERQALAIMDHPSIAKVLDAGATDTGRPYFVMELVRGIKITQYCDQNNLSTRQRLDLFVAVCQAVQHAHQKGIIHRDIKPSNILVTMHDGVPVPKVIDFGIAKATEGRLTNQTLFTAFEQFIGTPAYMSPEQAEMSGLDIDTRSDIYSLGVLLYELLTGKTPFDPDTLLKAGLDEMRRIIREKEPSRPSTRLSTMAAAELAIVAQHRHADAPKLVHFLRGDLDWIVMKTLEKDRTRRYQTAIGLANDIDHHLNNEPVIACPPSKLYRFQKMIRRNRLAFTAATAVGAALMLGTVVSTWQAVRANRAKREQIRLRQEAQSNEQKATENEHQAIESERRANISETNALSAAYVANLRAAESSLMLREIDEARRRLDACPKSFRAWEWSHLETSLDSSIEQYHAPAAPGDEPRAHSIGLESVTFSPDGKMVAAVSRIACAVWAVGKTSAPTILRLAGDGTKMPTAWSLQRSWVQFGRDPGVLVAATGEYVRVWDARSGTLQADLGPRLGTSKWWPQSEPGHSNEVSGTTCLAVSPDGARVAISDWSVTGVFDVSSGKRLAQVDLAHDDLGQSAYAHNGIAYCLTFSPDGRWILAGFWDGSVRLYRADDFSFQRSWVASETHYIPGMQDFSISPIHGIAVSPDGQTIAVASGDGAVWMFDFPGGHPLRIIRGHQGPVRAIAFSPSGKILASASEDKTVRLWDAQAGFPIATLIGHSVGVVSLSFSPDGHLLASADRDSVRLWAMGAETPVTALLGHKYKATDLSPAGSRIASSSADGTVRVWDSRSGRCLARIADNFSNRTLRIGHVVLEDQGDRVCWMDELGRVQVWNWATRELAFAFEPSTLPELTDRRESKGVLLASKDLSELVRAFQSGTLEFWALSKQTKTATLKIHDAPLTAGAVDWNWNVAGFTSQDGKLFIVDLRSRTVRARFQADPHGVFAVALSRDGAMAATAGSDRTIRIWNLGNGEEAGVLRGHDQGITSLAFSPGGTRLLSGSSDGTARLWDLRTHELLVTFRGHDDSVEAVAFTADETQVITGDFRGTLRIWETSSPKDRLVHRELAGAVDQSAERIVAEKRPSSATVADLVSAIRSDVSIPADVSMQAQSLARLLPEDWWDRLLNPDIPRGQAREILQNATQRAKLLPSDFDAHLLSAAAAYRLADFQRVIQEIGRADEVLRRTYPPNWGFGFDDFALGLFEAMAKARLGQVQQAVAGLNQRLGRKVDGPLDPRTLGLLSEAGDLLGVGPGSVIVELFNSPQAMSLASWNLVQKAGGTRREYEIGLILAQKARELNPSEVRNETTLGVALVRNGRWSEALDCLNRAYAAKEQSGYADSREIDLIFLAEAYQQTGNHQKAVELLEKAKTSLAGRADDEVLELLREPQGLIHP